MTLPALTARLPLSFLSLFRYLTSLVSPSRIMVTDAKLPPRDIRTLPFCPLLDFPLFLTASLYISHRRQLRGRHY